MREVRTEKEFKELWENKDRLVVKFTATWCGPCKMMAPLLKKLEADCKKAKVDVEFISIDVDNAAMETIGDMMNILSVPTILFVRNGQITKMHVGYVSEATLRKGFATLR